MTGEDLAARGRQWAQFNEWERSALPPERTPAACVADVGALYEWFSCDTKSVDPDPEKLGIQSMRAALARLRAPR
jgi:hypothetical protein